MVFCPNCGSKNDEMAKFCVKCGSTLAKGTDRGFDSGDNKEKQSPISGTSVKRQQVFAGIVIKCPSCGAELSSVDVKCPECGHEINSKVVAPAVKEFSERIHNCDASIAKSTGKEIGSGWSTWSKGKRVGWVILNVITVCIPIVISSLISFIGIGKTLGFSPEEKNKASLIDTYTFPNDRENVYGILRFICEQTNSLASGKVDGTVMRWIKIWKNRAIAISKAAESQFKDDPVIGDAIKDIRQNEKKARKRMGWRVAIAVVLLIVYVVFICAVGSSNDESSSESSASKTTSTFSWPENEYTALIPEMKSGSFSVPAEQEAGQFQFSCKSFSSYEYSDYCDACKNVGFSKDVTENDTLFSANNGEGYSIEIVYYDYNAKITIKKTEQ